MLELKLSGAGSQDRRNVFEWLQETYPITVHIPDTPTDVFPRNQGQGISDSQAESSVHEEAKRPRMDHEAILPKHLISPLWKVIKPIVARDDWDVLEMELLRYLLAANCQPANSPSDFARNKVIGREVANFVTEHIAVSIRTAEQAAELARILCYVWEGSYSQNLDVAARRAYERFYVSMTPMQKEALLTIGPIRNRFYNRNYGFRTYPMIKLLFEDIGNSAISTASHSPFLRNGFAVLRHTYSGPDGHINLRLFKMAITKQNFAAIHQRMIDAFWLSNVQLLIEAFYAFPPRYFSSFIPNATYLLEFLDTAEFSDALLSVVAATTKLREDSKKAMRIWCRRILSHLRVQDIKPKLHNHLLDHGIVYSCIVLARFDTSEYEELSKNAYSAAFARRIVERDDAVASPVRVEESRIQPDFDAARAIGRNPKGERQPRNDYYFLLEDCDEF